MNLFIEADRSQQLKAIIAGAAVGAIIATIIFFTTVTFHGVSRFSLFGLEIWLSRLIPWSIYIASWLVILPAAKFFSWYMDFS